MESFKKILSCLLTGVLFLLISGIILFQGYRTTTWEKTPCNIMEHKVRTVRSGKTKSNNTYIIYSYTVNNVDYTSDCYYTSSILFDMRNADPEGQFWYPPGTKNYCYVNPHNPKEAVLKKGLPPNSWRLNAFMGFIALVFMVGGSYKALRK